MFAGGTEFWLLTHGQMLLPIHRTGTGRAREGATPTSGNARKPVTNDTLTMLAMLDISGEVTCRQFICSCDWALVFLGTWRWQRLAGHDPGKESSCHLRQRVDWTVSRMPILPGLPHASAGVVTPTIWQGVDQTTTPESGKEKAVSKTVSCSLRSEGRLVS